MSAWVQGAILAIGFVLGVALMGVQMATSRYLTPYFGSGIDVWAVLISTVMLSLMAGYYIGGRVADSHPRTEVLGGAVLIAGIFLLAVPPLATPVLDWTLMHIGDGVGAALFASVAIMFLPFTLLSFFSPYAVRLLLSDAGHGGRVAGSVYSITTIGNIVGTLGTALVLMPIIGSRLITFVLAGAIIACGAALILMRRRASVAA
ncbi:MAG: fused MFS/spermidine synthase [Hyphomonadaceae bacterium]|nr:fused MFS/spermidine synthase [Hyphomonadaceae bacterium]